MKQFISLFLILTVCSGAVAQQAIRKTIDGYDYVAIDNSRLPAKVKKTTAEVNTIIDASTGRTQSHTELGDINKKVSPSFLISRVEMDDADGNPALSTNDANTMEWEEASNACKNYKGLSGNDAGKWRLPTLREAELIWILRPMIIELGYTFKKLPDPSNSSNSALYWTSTEYSDNLLKAWCIDFYAGNTNPLEKEKTQEGDGGEQQSVKFVRCIRDF